MKEKEKEEENPLEEIFKDLKQDKEQIEKKKKKKKLMINHYC